MTVSDDDSKTPLEHTLDVFVYLPVGFVLEFPQQVPRYIARGRKLLDPSRLLSRTASTDDLGSRIGRLQEQTHATLRALGVAGPSDRSPPAGPTSSPSTAGGNGSAAPTAAAPGSSPDPAAERPPPARPQPTPSHDPSELAITDYDSLSASQVVPRLDSLGDDELETVRQYEASTRGRKTILNKIAQIQSA